MRGTADLFSAGVPGMESGFISWLDVTKRWLEEHDERLVWQRGSEKLISGLQRQWEVASRHDKKEAVALAGRLSEQEGQLNFNRLMISIFEDAWSGLTVKEQRLLGTIHRQGLSRTEAIADLCIDFDCSVSTVRRHYSKALMRFKKLLLGQ